ncbi:MAG TPA: TPM domain-containing protein [Burkholderiaceae bacterium]|nr:TPM domain-containing protein [Burkholderiaceae bacterium]
MRATTMLKEMTGWASLEGQWLRRRHFTTEVLAAIAERIRVCERDHEGELVVAIEAVSPVHEPNSHLRALEVFGRLRVWDTPGNTGMLLYLALDKHRIEIIADRGIAAEGHEWEAVCARLQARLANKEYAQGILAAIDDIEAILRRCCPPSPAASSGAAREDDGLADEPVLL